MLPPTCVSRPAAREDVRRQRGRRRLAVGAGDGDERHMELLRPPLAHEQLQVADDLDAGELGGAHRPMRRRVRQRHAGRQHQGIEDRPVGFLEVNGLQTRLGRRLHTGGAVVAGHDLGPAGDERLGGGDAGRAQPKHRDPLSGERCDANLTQLVGIPKSAPPGRPAREADLESTNHRLPVSFRSRSSFCAGREW